VKGNTIPRPLPGTRVTLSNEVQDLIARALAEDVGAGDLTTEAVVDPGRRARGSIDQKEPGALFGLQVAEAVLRRLDPALRWEPLRGEGEWLAEVPATVVALEGEARALLTGERVALNFMQRLSGVATMTARAVSALEGTGVEVLDTRKTTPGMRELEKQAVASAGGRNHRIGLHDAMLVKENHIALAGGVGPAVRRALERRPPGCPVEVECRDLEEIEEALEAGAERLLLDNMSPAQIARAAAKVAGRATLEASGGITLQSIREYADAGVQFVSLGFLTHSAPALDLSMTIQTRSESPS
jgi:nicotinate-nucleotide pyrophosphorylase (carboxylating)